MKKVGVHFLFALLLVSFVSAGGFSLNFGEWFGKITGNAVYYPESSCVDFDPYQDVYLLGNLTYSTGEVFNTFYDSCESTSRVTQYSCEVYDDGTTSVSGSGYSCPNGCLNGACVNGSTAISNQTNATCIDSDGGLNYYDFGTVSELNQYTNGAVNSYPDMCLGKGYNNLAEAVCVDGYYGPRGSQEFYHCPNGCSNGACINSPTPAVNQINASCTDSDSGLNYYKKGSITVTFYSNQSYVLNESCVSGSNYLQEFYCISSSQGKEDSYLCPNGCVDGACVQENIDLSNPIKLVLPSSVKDIDISPNLVVFSYSSNGYDGGNGRIFDTFYNEYLNFNTTSIIGQHSIYKDTIVFEDYYSENGFEKNALSRYNISSGKKETIVLDRAFWPINLDTGVVYLTYYDDAYRIIYLDLITLERVVLYSSYVGFSVAASGDFIAWVTNDGGTSKLYLYNIKENKTEALPIVLSSIKSDLDFYGNKLVWIDNRYGGADVMMYDISTKEEVRITTGTFMRNSPKIYQNFIVWKEFRDLQNNDFADVMMYDISTKEEVEILSDIRPGYLDFFNDTIAYSIENDLYIFRLNFSSNDSSTPDEPETCESKFSCTIDPIICPANGVQIKTCSDVACETESYTETVSCNPGVCSGCQLDEKCIPYGFRTEVLGIGSYCDISGELKSQKKSNLDGTWATCQNNYECESNLCSSGECVDLNAIAKEAGAFAELWSKISCSFADLFGIEEYSACIADRFARYS